MVNIHLKITSSFWFAISPELVRKMKILHWGVKFSMQLQTATYKPALV